MGCSEGGSWLHTWCRQSGQRTGAHCYLNEEKVSGTQQWLDAPVAVWKDTSTRVRVSAVYPRIDAVLHDCSLILPKEVGLIVLQAPSPHGW